MASLIKCGLKSNIYSKDRAVLLKRKANQERIKQSRGNDIAKKRQILNQSPDSSNESALEINSERTQPVKKRKKPPRQELYKLWRQEKDSIKAVTRSQTKQPLFVVKRINYEDKNVFSSHGTSQKSKPKVPNHKKPVIIPQQQKQPSKKEKVKETAKKNTETAYMDKENKTIKTKNDFNLSKIDELSLRDNLKEIEINSREIMKEKKPEKGNAKQNLMDVLCTANSLISSDIISEDNRADNFETPIVAGQFTFEAPVGLALTNFPFDEKSTETVAADSKSIPMPNFNFEDSNPSLKNAEDNIISSNTKSGKILNITPFSKKDQELMEAGFPINVPLSILNLKERNNISLPSTPLQNSKVSRRGSLTPNPKNFLSQVEDPIAQRLASPVPVKAAAIEDISQEVAHCVTIFTNKVKCEEERFTALIETWTSILQQNESPSNVEGDILAAIGQAQLLMKKRFKQFKELIELHKDQSAEKAAHASDLDGFWEVVYFQVEDVYKRFKELEDMKANGWKLSLIHPVTKNRTKKANKAPVKKNKETKPVKPRTDFKKFRQQMLAKKKAEELQDEIPMVFDNDVCTQVQMKEEENPIKQSLLSSFNASFTSEGVKECSSPVPDNDLMMFSPIARKGR